MTVEQYHEVLKKFAPKQGLILNNDWEIVRPLLEGLLKNGERYGYRSCPCRPAAGVLEKDRDIVCPCVYAKPDIAEFGACYCWLYVSEDWNAGRVPHVQVPERRPVEKILDF
ncbi:MAG: ferredoxin:thioredoxin reductase [candidate division KSB1 bacterium]|nr:ferredoxin:thioredoxin reductase [candidate division KSB1 bacterium]